MKLYVGNLSFGVTEEALKKAFSKYGNIEEAIIIVDRFSKRSKGFGFITFSDNEAGKKAIAEMNEKEFEGRTLKVNEAKPMDDSDRPRRSFGGDRPGRPSGRGGSRRPPGRGGNRGPSRPGRSSGGSFNKRRY